MLQAATRFVSLFLGAATLTAVMALAAPAGAQEIGTRAFSNHPLVLHNGPHQSDEEIGQVPGGIQVRVDRCTNLWCHIRAGRHQSGWVFLYSLSFGQGPNSWFWTGIYYH